MVQPGLHFWGRVTRIPLPLLSAAVRLRHLRSRGCPGTGQGHRSKSPIALAVWRQLPTTVHCSIVHFDSLRVTGRQLLLWEITFTQYGQKSTRWQETIKTGFMKKSRFPVWKICSEWWLNTVYRILHCLENNDLDACQFLICFTGTISLTDRFACSSDFTSITFTVNNSFLFLFPYLTKSWLSAFYRNRIAFLLRCFLLWAFTKI